MEALAFNPSMQEIDRQMSVSSRPAVINLVSKNNKGLLRISKASFRSLMVWTLNQSIPRH